jgi:hypothetical protein
LGVKAIVLDAGDSWAQLLEGEGVIAKFVAIDFSDAEHVYEHCLKVGWQAQPAGSIANNINVATLLGGSNVAGL